MGFQTLPFVWIRVSKRIAMGDTVSISSTDLQCAVVLELERKDKFVIKVTFLFSVCDVYWRPGSQLWPMGF